ncbi:hypothetical protein QAD02_001337 [Eretmocerus hayati]|uniref:Uncharacterized protein n=1 Tax=Eretmocerus hayati TaxID=131215 RepID=A0ACC2NGP4_9HYME|nr:hypothetical protein QAD02_001337 [Eretmocerus hayati]
MRLDYDVERVPGYGSHMMALLPPKVNVSSRGHVPPTPQVFAIRLPCSGLESAEIMLSFKLNVSAPPETKYNDIRLAFKRNKICMKGGHSEIYDAKNLIQRPIFQNLLSLGIFELKDTPMIQHSVRMGEKNVQPEILNYVEVIIHIDRRFSLANCL